MSNSLTKLRSVGGRLGLSACFLAAVAALAQPVTTESSSRPVRAVLAWYDILDGAAGAKVDQGPFGSVGIGVEGLRQAYARLAPAFQRKTSLAGFEKGYECMAHVELLQAHLGKLDDPSGKATVFVEEERTLLLEGIGVVAWYAGLLQLARDPGGWKIAGFNLEAEDIISDYGGHQPWRGDPVEVAEALQYGEQACSPGEPPVARHVAVVEICGSRRYRVRLVEMHNEHWYQISTDP